MELWVRSQDRESLIKVSNVQYTYKEGSLYTDVNGKHYIRTYYDNLKILGTYKTKERALEVLDEIQMMDFANNPNVKLTSFGYVYEMPKE